MQKSDKEPVGNNRVVGNDFIRVACEEDHTFVYIPARLNRPYLEQVLSDSLRRKVAIRSCQTTNLCASVWGGVSHSGATVLRLSMALDDGDHLDVVAKVLCPDSVNLFKLDRRFSGRVAEIAWPKLRGRSGGASKVCRGCPGYMLHAWTGRHASSGFCKNTSRKSDGQTPCWRMRNSSTTIVADYC